MTKIKKFITALLIIILLGCLYFYIDNIKYTNEDFNIPTYISTVDKDNDGINDQSDILVNVRSYIATKPRYKSKYYGSGYPDDNYGVCTDVVAQGLLGAGYNLMELVNEDIYAHREEYNIDIVDKNIDFRRVRNLKIYFKNTATSLTTDIHQTSEWQGGDIIIFEKHIGIVSDKRNRKGIPFLIHHGSNFQLQYEENTLERLQDEIVGHYRIK